MKIPISVATVETCGSRSDACSETRRGTATDPTGGGAAADRAPEQTTTPDTEFAWRVHSALDSWTGKVDTKASIALAIQSAVLAFVVSLTEKGKDFASLHGTDLTWYRLAFEFLVVSILLSLFVVLPQLNRRQAKREWQSNMIYFGHVRRWDADDLASALEAHRATHPQLARQLVAMSKIAWRKHSCLQISLASLLVAGACLLVLAFRV